MVQDSDMTYSQRGVSLLCRGRSVIYVDSGVVWHGVVWSGVVWCGVVWHGVVWSGVVCDDTTYGERARVVTCVEWGEGDVYCGQRVVAQYVKAYGTP